MGNLERDICFIMLPKLKYCQRHKKTLASLTSSYLKLDFRDFNISIILMLLQDQLEVLQSFDDQ